MHTSKTYFNKLNNELKKFPIVEKMTKDSYLKKYYNKYPDCRYNNNRDRIVSQSYIKMQKVLQVSFKLFMKRCDKFWA